MNQPAGIGQIGRCRGAARRSGSRRRSTGSNVSNSAHVGKHAPLRRILWTGASPTTAYRRTGWRVVMRSRAKVAHEASRPPVPRCVRRRRPTKTAIWPRRDVIGRFARCGRSHHEWVVMLVPVLRGRAAVTLGHKTSSLGRTARSPRLWLRPGRAPSRDARHWDMAVVRFAVLSSRVSDMKASPSRSTLRRKIEAASRARTSGRTPGICPAQLPCRSMRRGVLAGWESCLCGI